METVGSSISSGGRVLSIAGEAMVSPMRIVFGPANQTISPAKTSSTSTRSSPLVTQMWAAFSGDWPVTCQPAS